MLKVLVFGSSFVNHLKSFDTAKNKIHTIAGLEAQFTYIGYRGKSFELFNKNPGITDNVLQSCPDYVVVLLGSNSITTDVEEAFILDQARDFYDLLTEKLKVVNSKAVIIASQVPLRFVDDPNNKFHTPSPSEYKRIRDKVNQKIKRLKCLKEHHFMLLIAGEGRLDSRAYFGKDGVHFNREGKNLQLKFILETIAYIINKKKQTA